MKCFVSSDIQYMYLSQVDKLGMQCGFVMQAKFVIMQTCRIHLSHSCCCRCPVAEWLERRAEEHIYSHCVGSKPARDNVMTFQCEKGKDDICMKIHYI